MLFQRTALLMVAMLLIVLGISVGLHLASLRDPLQNQLELRNLQAATLLALRLSQLPPGTVDKAAAARAHFEPGEFLSLCLQGLEGHVSQTLRPEPSAAAPLSASPLFTVPAWFVALLPIKSSPGAARTGEGQTDPALV